MPEGVIAGLPQWSWREEWLILDPLAAPKLKPALDPELGPGDPDFSPEFCLAGVGEADFGGRIVPER